MRAPVNPASFLRAALQQSLNRHWFGRVVVGCWALNIAVVGSFAPQSLVGRALERSGLIGAILLAVLGLLGLLALLDSASTAPNVHLVPPRVADFLMAQRHIGFMALAIVLCITGGGIAVNARAPVVFLSFATPAVLCVVVTWLDLYARHQGRMN